MARQKKTPAISPGLEQQEGAPAGSLPPNGETATEAAAPDPMLRAPKKAAAPSSVTLASFYSFYDEDGSHRIWQEGHVVVDADHIAALIERGAPIKSVEEKE